MIELPGVEPGNYAVGVSGGVDSVALLFLLLGRPDVSVHVVHLDHETRGGESAADAHFVEHLARRVGVGCTVARRTDVERHIAAAPPANVSARYRAARFALYRRVCTEQGLRGVILGHHAGDQAETVMLRLLRGSPVTGVTGMRARAVVAGVEVWRPLLAVAKEELRAYLVARGEAWREDRSNESRRYLRNRVRMTLAGRRELASKLIDLGQSGATVRDWVRTASPTLPDEFGVAELNNLPEVLSREAARRWIVARGVPEAQVDGTVIERLLNMAGDAASPATVNLPGGLVVRRRGGRIFLAG